MTTQLCLSDCLQTKVVLEISTRAPSWIAACWKAHKERILDDLCAIEWTDSMEEWERCWCCGSSEGKRLQRCHIVAKSIGGEPDPSNIVPLCRYCHDLMPDTPDPEFFWIWIGKQQNPMSGLGLGRYWPLMQSITEGLHNKDVSSVDHDAIVSRMRAQLRKTAIHFSQSGKGPETKISSIEWAILSVLNELPCTTTDSVSQAEPHPKKRRHKKEVAGQPDLFAGVAA